MKVLLLAGDFVEDYELFAPLKALEMLGIDVHVVCPDKKAGDTVQSAIHFMEEGRQTYSERQGHPFPLTHTFDDVNLAEYAGFVIPGGRFPEYQRYDDRVLFLCKHFFERDLPVAAICHGVQILAAAGVLQGRTCAGFHMCRIDVEAGGASFVEFHPDSKNAHVEGNLVTAPAYNAIGVWMREFIKLLGVKVQLE